MGGNDRGPAASGEKRLLVQGAAATSGGEAEECPRCGSHNTKFCYFNNYNLSQPRHFCKACRRYWTLGGTLRNVPVGGSTRRASQHQSKHQLSAAASCTRRRSVPAPPPVVAASPSSSSSSSPPLSSRLVFDTPSVIPPSAARKTELPGAAEDSGSMDAVRSFESLLAEPLPAGFLALGEPFLDGREGFGLGLGLGGSPGEIMEEMSFGLGKSSAWPFFGEEEGSLVGGNGNTAVSCVGGVDADREAWQDGSDGVDYFGWPELSMRSTVGKSMR